MAINIKQVYVDLRVKENPISYKILKIVLLYIYYCFTVFGKMLHACVALESLLLINCYYQSYLPMI